VIGTLSLTSWLKAHTQFRSVVLYFIASVLGGLLFLLSSHFSPLSGFLLSLSLFLKIGLFPFHFWVVTVLRDLSLVHLCFFLGPAKFGLIFLLVNSHFTSINLPLLALVFGLQVAYVSQSLFHLLYASGSCILLWCVLLGPSCFCSFFISYLLSLFAVSILHFRLLRPFVAFLNLGGLPPLTFF